MQLQSLSTLPLGASAVIRGLKFNGLLRQRLLDLGIVPGTCVKAVRRSPAGDPTAYAVRNTVIALRQEESGQILISPLNSGTP